MTAIAELQRIARDVVPPRGATAPIAVVEQTPGGRLGHPLEAYPNGLGGSTRYGVAWLIDGRVRTKPIVTFERGRDAIALIRILQGELPTPRPVPVPEPANEAARAGDDQERIEAPVVGMPLAPLPLPTPDAACEQLEAGKAALGSPRAERAGGSPGIRLCAGCDQPLPADARPNRTTHDGARRVRAARRRAGPTARRADTGGGVTVSTSHSPSDARVGLPSPAAASSWSLGDQMFEEAAGLGRRTSPPPPI